MTNALKARGPITLFNYLTSISDRVDWYRAIMRIFLQRSREYRYQLTAQDILETLQASPVYQSEEYSLDHCKTDLARLVSWGNLTTLYDTSRVTTITDFRSPVLLYQGTQEALAIENFLAEQANIGASEGGLHQGDLPRIWEALQQLDHWLRQDRTTLTSDRYQEIAEQWRIAFTTWERVTNDAAQYLGSMNRIAQNANNAETFLNYKNIVVRYIQSFAQQLVDYSRSISALLADWSQSGLQALLSEIVIATPPPLHTIAENKQLWQEDVQRQLTAFTLWFTREINVNMFVQAAHDASGKVIQRAYLLATSMGPQTDYVGMLYTLASHLLSVEDFETAQTLFAASFAHTLPIHLPEGITGTPIVDESNQARSVWQSPPTITHTLRPSYRGAIERSLEAPMRRDEEAIARLQQEHQQAQQEQKARFEHLFQTSELDIGTLKQIAPPERHLLISVIDACLSRPTNEYQLPDGAIVRLLNPYEQRYTALYSNDGNLILPQYQLRIQRKTKRATAIPISVADPTM